MSEQSTSYAPKRRGFAAMDRSRQREIARKGGLAVSTNRQHMADIGRKGGSTSHGPLRSEGGESLPRPVAGTDHDRGQ